jgi:tetratricopeptide (TPR) repeat protein
LSEDAESRGDATYLLPDLAQYALDMGSLHLAVSDPDQARGFIEYGRKVTDFFIGQVLSGEDEVLPDDDEGRTNVHTQRLVAVTAVGSGRLNIHAGDWATAEQEYRNALAIAREHLELTANEAVWRNIAGVCLDGLGDSLLAQGRLAEAADAYRQALQINTELASLALESVPWQIQRAISEYKIASLAGTGGAAPNRAAKRRALDIFRPLEQGMDLPEIFRATLVTLGY